MNYMLYNNLNYKYICFFNFKVNNKKMKKKEIYKFIGYTIILFLVKISLDYIYDKIVSTIGGYQKFQNFYSFSTSIFTWIVFFISLPIYYKYYKNCKSFLSYEIIFILYLTSFLPCLSMMKYNAITLFTFILYIFYWSSLLFFNELFCLSTSSVKLFKKNFYLNNKNLIIIFILFFLGIIYISYVYTGFRINFDIYKVYELRADSKNYSMPKLLRYLFTWSKVVISILASYFLINKRYFFVFLCIICQILSFGIDGAKVTIFLLGIILILSIIPKNNFTKLNKFLSLCFLFILLISILLHKIFDSIFIPNVFIRRMLFTPILLADNYVDFFTSHVPDFFRQGFLRRFGLQSPYPNIAYMIGDIYYNRPEMSANSGLLADAVTNFGISGIIFMPLILTFCFYILDKLSKKIDNRLCLVIAFYISMILLNSALMTSLLTHGLFLIYIFLYCLRKNEVK